MMGRSVAGIFFRTTARLSSRGTKQIPATEPPSYMCVQSTFLITFFAYRRFSGNKKINDLRVLRAG